MQKVFSTVDAGRIQHAMTTRRLTMTALAKQSDVSYSTIRDIVKGRRCSINQSTLWKLADALQTEPDELKAPTSVMG